MIVPVLHASGLMLTTYIIRPKTECYMTNRKYSSCNTPKQNKTLPRSPHSLQKVVVHAFFQDNYLKSVELPDTLKVNRHFRFWILRRNGTHHLQSLSPCKNQHRTPSIFWWKCQRMYSLCKQRLTRKV